MSRETIARRGAGQFGARYEQRKSIEKAIIVALYCAAVAGGIAALIVQLFAP